MMPFDDSGDASFQPKGVLTPHLDKLEAALLNPKFKADRPLLKEAVNLYYDWVKKLDSLSSSGKKRVMEMVDLLNWYKDQFEIELIMKRGSIFLRRQKGQLKLDNTIMEEFLIRLIRPDILKGLDNLDKLVIGPQNAFLSLAFLPSSVKQLTERPNVVLKTKDQDFVIGAEIFYKFATDDKFGNDKTVEGSLLLSVLATECKINLDKTMFQEAAGTAARLKQGCPVAKYFLLVEYLDMEPEDCRLTAIDNVLLLRHARRLPFGKRDVIEEVEMQHKKYPIDANIIWRYVQEIQSFIDAALYNPDDALKRGSFA